MSYDNLYKLLSEKYPANFARRFETVNENHPIADCNLHLSMIKMLFLLRARSRCKGEVQAAIAKNINFRLNLVFLSSFY